jgi:predicted nucleic acid-binding protein
MNVFVDTSALYALWDGQDSHHARAEQIFRGLMEKGAVLHIHDWIFLEAQFLLGKRLGRAAAVQIARSLCQNQIVRIHAVDSELRDAALKEYEARPVSLVDAASFTLMRREGLENAFTFDEDFITAGFRMVQP